MKKIIVLGMVLIPCLVHAATDCKVVEYADHYDVTCVGDEKSVPVPASQSVTMPAGVTAPIASPQTTATPSGMTPASTPAMPAPVSAQTSDSPQTPVVHRQGRPPQSVRDEAKAMRNKLIDERQNQP